MPDLAPGHLQRDSPLLIRPLELDPHDVPGLALDIPVVGSAVLVGPQHRVAAIAVGIGDRGVDCLAHVLVPDDVEHTAGVPQELGLEVEEALLGAVGRHLREGPVVPVGRDEVLALGHLPPGWGRGVLRALKDLLPGHHAVLAVHQQLHTVLVARRALVTRIQLHVLQVVLRRCALAGALGQRLLGLRERDGRVLGLAVHQPAHALGVAAHVGALHRHVTRRVRAARVEHAVRVPV
mmetsp:Transcript_108451/g.350117  ORF Transcript_108451/g.350117 Transcript_108451/m.350117 type:complete len:236 (-) Transcript_108451:1724-2431(-)